MIDRIPNLDRYYVQFQALQSLKLIGLSLASNLQIASS
jgi:hypothetical protein